MTLRSRFILGRTGTRAHLDRRARWSVQGGTFAGVRNLGPCLLGLALVLVCACAPMHQKMSQKMRHDVAVSAFPAVGSITVFDPNASGLLRDGTQIERLTEDTFGWSEGPVWIPAREDRAGFLLFTDVPGNTMYRWDETGGLSVFLQPSGLVGEDGDGIFREPGANGLTLNGDGGLVMGDHGHRAVAVVDLETLDKRILADRYEGARLNSPNDVVVSRAGMMYFTDPPYGLAGLDGSPAKQLLHNGVYALAPVPGSGVQESGELGSPGGLVTLLDGSLSRPNGVALSPDEGTLYVTVSDPEAAHLYAYTLTARGDVSGPPRLLYDFTAHMGPDAPGLPDGMAVDGDGRIYVAGPGGVHVLSAEGERLALISTGTAAANCAFGGPKGSTLFITSGAFLARVELNLSN